MKLPLSQTRRSGAERQRINRVHIRVVILQEPPTSHSRAGSYSQKSRSPSDPERLCLSTVEYSRGLERGEYLVRARVANAGSRVLIVPDKDDVRVVVGHARDVAHGDDGFLARAHGEHHVVPASNGQPRGLERAVVGGYNRQ